MSTTRDEIDCPRAKTSMTPCIARDGALALSDHDDIRPLTCIGCSAKPRDLLLELADRYAPARKYRQTHAPIQAANRLKQLVAEHVSS